MKKFIAFVLIISLFVMTTGCSGDSSRPMTTTSAVKVKTLKAATDACDGAVYITVTANPLSERVTMTIENELEKTISLFGNPQLVDTDGYCHQLPAYGNSPNIAPHSKAKIDFQASFKLLTEGAKIVGEIFVTTPSDRNFSLILKDSE